MIVIADSGSSKTHWSFLNDAYADIFTKGINPYYINSKEIYEVLEGAFENKFDSITEVYFFSAGCNTQVQKKTVEDAILQMWPKAIVHVESDILAACYATSMQNKGISCILGTGANSCYFDGVTVQQNIPPLGFILGDEGSGAYLGKQLVNAIYKGKLSDEIKAQFEAEYDCDMAGILNKVYKQSFPNRYLASFVPFIKSNISIPEFRLIVEKGFRQFLKNNVLQYPEAASLPIHFVGSVAYYFKDILEAQIEKKGLIMGKVLRSPMEGLKLYYNSK
ncbi:hypothetical protein [Saccharicrinis aurantiacus]|uniref:hypothetical protein n=1 Tax=Saccharicrinis aurantiacus TaxID=1849719 RepID=UPI00094FB0AF|nr:hypothetical protein [Saccharicrinis aurantiacus]